MRVYVCPIVLLRYCLGQSFLEGIMYKREGEYCIVYCVIEINVCEISVCPRKILLQGNKEALFVLSTILLFLAC
jgi:hypothetical protein